MAQKNSALVSVLSDYNIIKPTPAWVIVQGVAKNGMARSILVRYAASPTLLRYRYAGGIPRR